jgi:hypothetical protein
VAKRGGDRLHPAHGEPKRSATLALRYLYAFLSAGFRWLPAYRDSRHNVQYRIGLNWLGKKSVEAGGPATLAVDKTGWVKQNVYRRMDIFLFT